MKGAGAYLRHSPGSAAVVNLGLSEVPLDEVEVIDVNVGHILAVDTNALVVGVAEALSHLPERYLQSGR